MKKNPAIKLGGIACSLLLLAGTARGVTTTISVNWKEFAGAVNDPIEPYGVVSASTWINSQGGASFTDMATSGGGTSTVDLSVTGSGGSAGQVTYDFSTLNNTPMRAGLRVSTAAGSRTLDLSGLSATFSSYDIIVYVAGYNWANNTAVVSDGATTYYAKVPSPFSTALIQSTDTVDDAIDDEGTYVRFNGLSGDTQSIVMSRQGGEVGIGGIQITGEAVPEPGAVTLFGLALLPAFLRRRRS